ncbi:alpha-ketoglutarate-dependent dioxygenase AlkB family protein [Actinokineospora diospyrosa]|uniref:Alkylated DNA repair protein (DNA oxidative demethylase) n=1 Tax=Actinokineospora diospyrosa TaxID=103728 RepID=A0ABT1I880_9PSEU|nr:alpha-ketoglutarate-dependent dioxygenase AlkB [Actinokineospora diospyrosa]MCP2268788.1 alkylated DNA repair protein (DNA oxidative demethylase) [Actinokineospora diospyrosa]
MELIPRPRRELAPGAVHLPDWLDCTEQRRLLAACREWSPGMRHQRLPNGGVMSVRMVCLGWHWAPYRYTKVLDDGSAVLPFPNWLGDLGRRAVTAAGFAPDYRPDIALVNFYDADAKMGLHQDKDERALDPVVSFSLGDTAVFRFGNTENRGRPWTDVELRSGDLVVFGGESRLAYHGITKVLPGTADPDLGLTGRLNITLRASGMD